MIGIWQSFGTGNYYVFLIMVFTVGLATASRYNIAIVYAVEFTTKEWQLF